MAVGETDILANENVRLQILLLSGERLELSIQKIRCGFDFGILYATRQWNDLEITFN
jgi:hypothetical protein